MSMKLLSFVTLPYLYRGCSTWKTLWEEKFTGEEKFILSKFTYVNMKNCVRQNVRKHRDIKDSDKYTTLDISLKLGSLENIRIISLEPKDYLETPVKGLITIMGLKENVQPKKINKVKVNHWKYQYEESFKDYQ